jgi:uncharacterized membrane protein
LKAAGKAVTDPKLETIISMVLIVGVVASMALEAVGIGLFYGAYGNLQVSQDSTFFIRGENFFAFIVQEFQSLFARGSAVVFMTAGLIILILTPYIRAITSFIYFTWEKNGKYVAITLFVIAVLTLSLALH